MHVFGGGLFVPRSLLVLIRQLVIGPLIVVGPGASAQVSPCVKAALHMGHYIFIMPHMYKWNVGGSDKYRSFIPSHIGLKGVIALFFN